MITFIFQAAGGGMAAVGGSIASTGEKVSRSKRFDERLLIYDVFLSDIPGRSNRSSMQLWSLHHSSSGVRVQGVSRYAPFPHMSLLIKEHLQLSRKTSPEKWHNAVTDRRMGSRFAWRRDWTVLYRVLIATCVGYLVRTHLADRYRFET